MLFNAHGYDSVNKRITSSQLRFMIRAVCVYHLLTTTADAELKEKRKMNLTSNIISCNGFPRYSAVLFHIILGNCN